MKKSARPLPRRSATIAAAQRDRSSAKAPSGRAGRTTPEGIHLGALAGTVDLVQRGQTALEFREGTLWISPCLPTELQGLHLKLLYRGYWLYLDIGCDRLTVSAPHGWAGPARIGVRYQVRPFKAGDVLEFGCHLAEGGWRPVSRAPTRAQAGTPDTDVAPARHDTGEAAP